MKETLKAAQVSYGDWTGTAAADQHKTTNHKTPYELVGLDPEKWWIVGVDFRGEDLNTARGLHIYAVDKKKTDIADWEDLQLHGEKNGSVPVTDFLVHNVTPADFIGEVFNDFHVQLRTRSINHDIQVVKADDLNYQKD